MRGHSSCVLRGGRRRALADDRAAPLLKASYLDTREGRRPRCSGVAHHRCLDALKARRRAALHFQESPELPEGESRAPTAAEGIDQRRREHALEACLGELSAEVRAAVILRFHDQMTYEAMAEILGEKPATPGARVARAMPVLRRCLESKGMEP